MSNVTRHPWLWRPNDVRKALARYRAGEEYDGRYETDTEAMADDIEDLLDYIDTLKDKIARLEEK